MYRKYLLILIVILFLNTGNAFSVDLLSVADELSNQGRYDKSITEYKRYIFFNQESAEIDSAFYKMGLAYRAMRDWHHALEAIQTSIAMAKTAEVADERTLTLGTTMIASGDYSFAKLELIKLIDSAKSKRIRLKALYFSGVTSVYTFDWDATSKYFGDFYAETDSEDRAIELNSILSRTKKSSKSARTAEIFSIFIPGAGQAYSGNWRDGINAFLLNGLLIGFTANSIYKKDYSDALLIFALLTSRYYMGNIYHAGKDAERYNEELDRYTAEKILGFISSDEP